MKSKTQFARHFLLSSFIFLILILPITFNVKDSLAQNIDETRARLQNELNLLEAQIAEQQKVISTTQAQSASLSRDISILQAKINERQLQIKKIDNNITVLSSQILDKNIELGNLSDTMESQRDALSGSLRNMNIFDGSNNFVTFILTDKSLSQFFEDINKIGDLQNAINNNVSKIKNTTDKVNQVKSDLENNKDSQLALKNQQKVEQDQISVSKSQKNTLLKETKGQEVLYKKQLSDKQAEATKIKAALFKFAGGSTAAISFGDALNYAKAAQVKTGVSAAFVLAILTQESSLGANVGKCYLSDTSTGAGYNISSGKKFPNVMKASRDIPVFLKITASLGMDPLKTVVSCPIPSAGGYGGAMGPAQFIPSTWKEVASEIDIYNPWNAHDAIFASSRYLADLGAATSYLSQIKAACRYYGTGGSNCSYGKSVMSKVPGIQSNIDYLTQYSK
ncbi:MAG: lytic murein transglycosylase [Candidatus Pacebacteria bacterium]|nr:lytic murein transglycosylase [Candidatus Paceibacterota bacterium]